MDNLKDLKHSLILKSFLWVYFRFFWAYVFLLVSSIICGGLLTISNVRSHTLLKWAREEWGWGQHTFFRVIRLLSTLCISCAQYTRISSMTKLFGDWDRIMCKAKKINLIQVCLVSYHLYHWQSDGLLSITNEKPEYKNIAQTRKWITFVVKPSWLKCTYIQFLLQPVFRRFSWSSGAHANSFPGSGQDHSKLNPAIHCLSFSTHDC